MIVTKKFVFVVLIIVLLSTVTLGCVFCKWLGKGATDMSSTSSKKDICCPSSDVKLDQLIPISMVIAAGCVSCTEMAIDRATQNGVSKEQIKEVISIVSSFQQSKCFRDAVGQEIVDRMNEPLKTANKILGIQ